MPTQAASNTTKDVSRSQSRPEEMEGLRPLEDLVEYARNYAKKQPEMAALYCLGIGFVLGWKLKPW